MLGLLVEGSCTSNVLKSFTSVCDLHACCFCSCFVHTARASRSKIHVCVVDDRLHVGLVNIGVQHLSICLQTAAKKTFDGQCMLNDQPNIQVAILLTFRVYLPLLQPLMVVVIITRATVLSSAPRNIHTFFYC